MMNKSRENLMKKVQMYAFVAHECALYLDCHPQNAKALAKHAEAVKELKEAVAEYENMYGPLTANAAGGNGGWDWVAGKWPWQNYDEKEAKR